METKAPFDLAAAIQRWRENLAQSPAFRAENLTELESHLRDSIARLQTAGLSADEAFMVAEKRIGREGVLEAEFKKINRGSIWLERFFWMLLGVQVSTLVVNTLCVAGREVLFFSLYKSGFNFGNDQSLMPHWAMFEAGNLVFFTGGLALCWWLLCRRGKIMGDWMARLLRNRVLCGVTFCAILLIPSLITTVVGLKLLPSKAFLTAIRPTQISSPIQNAALLSLTFYLAAKRFRRIPENSTAS